MLVQTADEIYQVEKSVNLINLVYIYILLSFVHYI